MPQPRIIYVDSRERTPLPIPRHLTIVDKYLRLQTVVITREKKTLHTADYTTPNKRAGVERKGSPRELWGCCCGQRNKAFLNQLDRMAKHYRIPYLFTEFDPFKVKASLHVPKPIRMGCIMLHECQQRGVAWIHRQGYASRDRSPGAELVCRVLLQADEV